MQWKNGECILEKMNKKRLFCTFSLDNVEKRHYNVDACLLACLLARLLACSLARSEGESFVGNDELDKAQAAMPVFIRLFLFCNDSPQSEKRGGLSKNGSSER